MTPGDRVSGLHHHSRPQRIILGNCSGRDRQRGTGTSDMASTGIATL